MRDGKFVILTVDDDPDIIDTIRLVLEANDYIVVAANSAEQGFKLYKSEKPDLVLVDLMMEEVDSGTTLVTKLKALGNTAPVYMLSAVGNELHHSIDHEQLGLAGVFQKPVDTNTLLKTLKFKLKK
jgi:DNA-binding response OmpR family regulator